ncbi:hypothetical protein HDU92_003201 [Lobulomyces angularis]|nr:hypothetical protein HDU92_003201 [Lobulomyces angularis]
MGLLTAFNKIFKKNKNQKSTVEVPYSTTELPPKYKEKVDGDKSFLHPEIIEKSITQSAIDSFSKHYNSNPKNELAQTVIKQAKMETVLLNNDALIRNEREFEIKIKLEGNVTNQKQSGRCWIFASTNTIRLGVMKRFHLKEFELSQNFIFFYDKLEKANSFLQKAIDLADKNETSNAVQELFSDPMQDGGTWNTVASLVEKYGICPKSAFPETYHSENSTEMDWLLTNKIREYGVTLRRLIHAGEKSPEEILQVKAKMMNAMYRIIVTCLGEPPKSFDWKFRCTKGHFHSFENLTPKSFYEEHIKKDVIDKVNLTHDPRHKFFKKKEEDGTIYGTKEYNVNVPIEVLKEAVIVQLKNNDPATFACDVHKFYGKNTMDMDLFNYEAAFDLTPTAMSRLDRVTYKESYANHEMVFTGVHLDSDQKPLRWRVENSWGAVLETTGRHAGGNGAGGFEVMNDAWFNEYVFDVVIDKKYLSEGNLLKVANAIQQA